MVIMLSCDMVAMLSCDMVAMLSCIPALAGASAFLDPPQALKATRTVATITFLIPAPVWGWGRRTRASLVEVPVMSSVVPGLLTRGTNYG